MLFAGKRSTFFLISVMVCYTFVTIFSFSIPFFWDNVRVVSQAASFILEHHFSIILPAEIDSGHAPIIAFYFAFMWGIFGKTLMVSHLLMVPFVIGLIWEFYKLAKQYLTEKHVKVALLFLLLEPVFCTQTILMGYDIIIAYFFIAAINCLKSSQKIRLIVMLSFLLLTNLRGIPLAVSVFLIDIFIYKRTPLLKFLKQNFLNYLIPWAIAILWFIYHYNVRDWLLLSPSRAVQRQFNTAAMMFRHAIYIIWKLADYGKIIFWIFLLLSSIKLFKTDINCRKLLILLFIPIICLSITMIPFSNPIGHKYFVPIYLLLVIATVSHLQFLKPSALKNSLIILFCIISFAGNFIMYPERFGNGWDTSLKVLNYFPTQKKMDEFVSEKKIAPEQIAVSFPMFENRRYTYLTEDDFAYSDIDNRPLEKWTYIIITNISNSYSDHLKLEVRVKWKLLGEYKSGLVYLQLYQNPTSTQL